MEKLTPKETVHKFCHRCVCNRADDEVANCGGHIVYATGKECPFYPYRNGEKRISVKVFRAFCMECQGDSYKAIDECKTEKCLLHPYRYGRNPAMIGRMNVRSRGLNGRLIKNQAF